MPAGRSSLLLVTLGSGIMAPASVSSRSSFTVTDCVATSFGTSKVSLSEDLSFTCRDTGGDISLGQSLLVPRENKIIMAMTVA